MLRFFNLFLLFNDFVCVKSAYCYCCCSVHLSFSVPIALIQFMKNVANICCTNNKIYPSSLAYKYKCIIYILYSEKFILFTTLLLTGCLCYFLFISFNFFSFIIIDGYSTHAFYIFLQYFCFHRYNHSPLSSLSGLLFVLLFKWKKWCKPNSFASERTDWLTDCFTNALSHYHWQITNWRERNASSLI